VKRSRTLNHYGGDLLQTMACFGLSRVRTELFRLLVIPSSAPHPMQTNRQSPRHSHSRDLSSSSHRSVGELVAPTRIAAHRHLLLPPVQYRVALFTEMSQPSSFPAGVFCRYQTEIAGDLLTATSPMFCKNAKAVSAPTPGWVI
jgi:hypothetical protein